MTAQYYKYKYDSTINCLLLNLVYSKMANLIYYLLFYAMFKSFLWIKGKTHFLRSKPQTIFLFLCVPKSLEAVLWVNMKSFRSAGQIRVSMVPPGLGLAKIEFYCLASHSFRLSWLVTTLSAVLNWQPHSQRDECLFAWYLCLFLLLQLNLFEEAYYHISWILSHRSDANWLVSLMPDT